MKRTITLSLLLSFAGCFGGSSEVEVIDSGGPSVQTSCGAVVDGDYQNPVAIDLGEQVRFVGAPSNNVVILRNADGEDLLVRLLGLSGEPSSRSASAISYIRSFSRGTLLYYPAGCQEGVSGGGTAALGTVFNLSGDNLAEELAKAGLVSANPNDGCGGAEYGQCLESLAQFDPVTAGELPRFLWKPVSDSDGGLAIHTSPSGTTVVVNGVTGRNQGGGNGYGSLARFSPSGCAFGNPQIQVFNSRGLLYTVNGETTFTVPNPCGRYCVEDGNGQVFSCPKS